MYFKNQSNSKMEQFKENNVSLDGSLITLITWWVCSPLGGHMAFDEIESNKHDLTSWVETRLSQLIIFLYILI